MRQALFVAVLGDDDQHVDGLTVELRVVGEQRIGRFDTQVGGFLISILARQERRTDFPEDELFILLELRTLRIVIQPTRWHVAGNAFYANHCGFPILDSWRSPLA
ncbi:hypothetical protein D3C78_564470 [compost metagenome]